MSSKFLEPQLGGVPKASSSLHHSFPNSQKAQNPQTKKGDGEVNWVILVQVFQQPLRFSKPVQVAAPIAHLNTSGFSQQDRSGFPRATIANFQAIQAPVWKAYGLMREKKRV